MVFAGEFVKPGKSYCSLGQVLVIGMDYELSAPSERDLKDKVFYAGEGINSTSQCAAATWHLSVM